MNKFFRVTLLLLLTSTILTGCVKSIIQDEEGQLDNRNIEIRVVYYWENYFLRRDSIYQKDGARFKIDNIEMILSNFYYNNEGDTVTDWTQQSYVKMGTLDHKLGSIMEPSISGSIGWLIGLDSLMNATEPGDHDQGDVLSNSNLYSGSKIGYNFFTLTGRVFDPDKPDETEPSIPMKWVVATNAFVSTIDSKRSFSIPVGKQVIIDASVFVDKLFDDMQPVQTPIIKSDPDDADDYAEAMQLHDNLQKAFFIP
jgi:hypothetical protein